MCFYTYEQKELVAQTVKAFLEKGQPFTGWEVHQELKETGKIGEAFADFASKAYSICPDQVWAPRETSAYVRELFNKGEMPGWASMQVVPKKGPVLYFKVSKSTTAYKVAAEIRDKMAATEVEN